MHIGILQCDYVYPDFRESEGDYPDMFMRLLSAIEPTLKFSVYPVIDGIFPSTTDECDAWLITGSRHGTYEQLSWIGELTEWIRSLHKDQRRMVGICFGHQLIAQALGGRSGKSDRGWGVGLQTWDLQGLPPGIASDHSIFSLIASHQDQVSHLPTGAELVASSEFCPNAAYRIDSHVLTFQGHPEFSHAYSRGLMNLREDRIPQHQLEAGLASLEGEADDTEVARWIVSFLSGTTLETDE